ncbi:hypothetical protein [Streptomyces sp. NPDC020917]|uniref:hypothetical protein n=1 Tax=Streptomyces sp. NPDC020917 TaxID=3365102 RepID=UPI0037BDDACF
MTKGSTAYAAIRERGLHLGLLPAMAAAFCAAPGATSPADLPRTATTKVQRLALADQLIEQLKGQPTGDA